MEILINFTSNILSFTRENNIVFQYLLSCCLCFSFFYFPDIDLRYKIFRHRDAFTHSVFIPLLFYFSLSEHESLIILGVTTGFFLHLIYDLFPRKYSANGLVFILKHKTSPAFSYVFLLINAFFSAILMIININSIIEYIYTCLITLTIVILNRKSEKKIIRPLLILTVFLSLYFIKNKEMYYQYIKPIIAIVFDIGNNMFS